MDTPSLLPSLRSAALAGVLAAVPGALWGQRRSAVTPLVAARPAARIALPEFLAVEVDSTFVLLLPQLFELRNTTRSERGRLVLDEISVQRDSSRAAREVVGKVVALHAETGPAGAGRVRAVRPNRCADPPGWCPPIAVIEAIGQEPPAARPLLAVNPPPSEGSAPAEITDDEAAAAASALILAARSALGSRAMVRDEQLGTPAIFVLGDSTDRPRVLVAAGLLDQGRARPISALVVGLGGDTLVRNASGRATVLAPGSTEELRYVWALDFDGDGRNELLLAWQGGSEWRFEILAADRAGRWTQQWRGPDRSPPSASRRARPAGRPGRSSGRP